MATDFMPRSSTFGKSWSSRMAPSSRLYCVCRWRWEKSAMRSLQLYLRALWTNREPGNYRPSLTSPLAIHNSSTGGARARAAARPLGGAPKRARMAAVMPGAVRRSPAARVLCAALAACAGTAAACGGPEAAPPTPTTPRTLAATPESISVPPGGMGTLGFVLLGPTGAPLPGAVVAFAIVDAPTAPSAKAQGAALATASAATDAQGRCAAHVTAGLAAVIRLRATSPNAQVDVVVVVAAADVGAADAPPFFPAPAGAHAAAVATTIEILFFDNSSCGDARRGLARPHRLPARPGAALARLHDRRARARE